MTNYFENLDIALGNYRSRFMSAYDRGDYITAASWLYKWNSAHPSKAYVADMPIFSLKSNSIRAKLSMNNKAQYYCDHWLPILEIAMANFREANQAEYNRV